MEGRAGTPVHLWVVAGVTTLWNAFGALDYTMTQTGSAAWMAQLSPAQIAWLDAAPAWAVASWACGVWGALVGSLLLLVRSRHAVIAFAVSLAGLAVNTLFQATSPMPGSHMDGGGALALHLAIWAVAIALLAYALRMRARGVLR
ncbi:hypothetical protein [Sphingosinicella sp. LY1275]|uniref:hypothetical protein n=1 Tax=Sphingosinicella sp. LY1275 TaxID=3095379 RepID=UPI002ADEC09E|nr:hypothetical protein [Sphingosinicella sp. LY1275]MEA1013505.1 hypothetical protein [Sphingosinicella sp. LY1275]